MPRLTIPQEIERLGTNSGTKTSTKKRNKGAYCIQTLILDALGTFTFVAYCRVGANGHSQSQLGIFSNFLQACGTNCGTNNSEKEESEAPGQ